MTGKDNIKLEEINKKNPFDVPDGYFEHFSVRMTDKISQAEAAKAPVAARAWLRPKMVVAFAGIAVVLLIGVVFINLHNRPLSSGEMIEAYKYSALQELTDEQMAQMLSDKQNEQQTGIDSVKQAKEKEAIIEYLSKENIDINTIIDAQ